ncbi:glycosyltransferase [Clostridium sp. UBA7791]|uniref:glycosyltransferase n=1 Tax=Clostridium sp. UBA7791 TaxID=1946379 RepID=UPI0032173C18
MLLSVIVPVYNSEKFIADCIESVINQTYVNIEMIIVNDGSTDKSYDICKEYSSKYESIRFFSIENSGSAYARNYGLKQAKGDYVAFIDSDDWIELDMFEKLMLIGAPNKLDIVSCNLIHVKNNGKRYIEKSNNRGGIYNRNQIRKEIFPVLINSSSLSQQEWPMRMVTKIYNRDFLIMNNIGFENELRAAQDFVFSVTAMYHASSFYYLKDESLYYYRENFESRTHKHLHKAWDNYLSMNNYLKQLLEKSNEYDFSNQLELSKLHGILSSISYIYRDGNKNSFLKKYKYTKEIASYYDLINVANLIDWEKTPMKKKIFIFLLKNRMCFLVALLANSYYLAVDRVYRKILKGRVIS